MELHSAASEPPRGRLPIKVVFPVTVKNRIVQVKSKYEHPAPASGLSKRDADAGVDWKNHAPEASPEEGYGRARAG